MFLRPKHVKIMAQVDDEWSFQIEAPGPEAYACLADWISIVTASNNDDGTAAPPTGCWFQPHTRRRPRRLRSRHLQGRRR